VPSGAQEARVVDVADGDTLTIAAVATGAVLSTTEPVRVRLLQIDTPEQGEPLSDEATAELVALTGPGTTVWALRDQDSRDRYGRELLYLWSGDGTFVNEQMVLSGLATAVLVEPNDRYIDRMRAAEERARSAGLGLWAPPPPPPPPSPPPPPPAPPVPETAPEAAPQPLVPAPGGGGDCDPSYPGVCIPPYPPDLDCGEIEYRRFEVRQPDPHGFDGDKDGIGCESG
jgi:micrococcal nuclease